MSLPEFMETGPALVKYVNHSPCGSHSCHFSLSSTTAPAHSCVHDSPAFLLSFSLIQEAHFHKWGNIASTPAKPFHYITSPVSPLHDKANCQELDLWYFSAFKMVKQGNCCRVPWKAPDMSTSINIDVFSRHFIWKTFSQILWFLLVLRFNSPDINIKAGSCVTSAQLCS